MCYYHFKLMGTKKWTQQEKMRLNKALRLDSFFLAHVKELEKNKVCPSVYFAKVDIESEHSDENLPFLWTKESWDFHVSCEKIEEDKRKLFGISNPYKLEQINSGELSTGIATCKKQVTSYDMENVKVRLELQLTKMEYEEMSDNELLIPGTPPKKLRPRRSERLLIKKIQLIY